MNKFFFIVCTWGSWPITEKENSYVRPFVRNVGVSISTLINYQGLIELVKEKTCHTEVSNIKLYFQHPECKYVIDVIYNNDVRQL